MSDSNAEKGPEGATTMSKSNGNTTATPATATVTTDFVREAIREKASRELAQLNQRAHAFGGVERARDQLHQISSDLTASATAINAVSGDATSATKLKKLRKLVEDALSLATELADVMGVDRQREALDHSRQAILDALKSAGIDPSTVLTTAGGDAQ